MKVNTSTGGRRDFIELEPETLDEVGQIFDVANGILHDADKVALRVCGHPRRLVLDIYVSEERDDGMTADVRAAMDQTP